MAIASQKITDVFVSNLRPPEIPLDTILDLWHLRYGSLLCTVRVVDIQNDAPSADFLTRNYIRIIGYIRARGRDWRTDTYVLDRGPYRLRLHRSSIDDTILSRLELKDDDENHREQSAANTHATPG